MAQNENISLSLANKIDILNKTQSVDARYGVYDSEAEALVAMSDFGLDGRQVAVYTDKPNGKVQLFLYNQVLHQLEPVTGFTEAPAQPSKYEILNEAPVLAGVETGTDTDGYVIIGATPTNLLSFTYEGSEPFEYDSYIQLDTTIDLELHKRYDVVCLTPTGGIELIEGISIGVVGVQVPSIPPIPPNYFPYAYVLWDGTATTILANQVTKVSQLINDLGFTPNAIPLAEKAEPNGVATLDIEGKIPSSQLPNAVMTLEGEWNANTNTPTLSNGTGNAGMIYEVTTAGTVNLGSGNITFNIGDWVVYGADNKWYKSLNSNEVTSVNSKTGTVTLTQKDIIESEQGKFLVGDVNDWELRKLAGKDFDITSTADDRVPIWDGILNTWKSGGVIVSSELVVSIPTIAKRTSDGRLKASDAIEPNDLVPLEQLNASMANSKIVETSSDYTLIQADSGKTVFLTAADKTVTVPTSGLLPGFFVNIKFKDTGGKIIDLSETLNGDNEGYDNGTAHNYDVPKNGVLIFTRMNDGTLDVTGDII